MKIGTLIHERIMRTPCAMRAISPASSDEIFVDKSLFGWELRLRREPVPCESEAVARYLAAFARMGFVEVPVPLDHHVIEDVVEDLERAVTELAKHIEDEISGELNPFRRKQLLEMVWEGARERLGITGKQLQKPVCLRQE